MRRIMRTMVRSQRRWPRSRAAAARRTSLHTRDQTFAKSARRSVFVPRSMFVRRRLSSSSARRTSRERAEERKRPSDSATSCAVATLRIAVSVPVYGMRVSASAANCDWRLDACMRRAGAAAVEGRARGSGAISCGARRRAREGEDAGRMRSCARASRVFSTPTRWRSAATLDLRSRACTSWWRSILA